MEVQKTLFNWGGNAEMLLPLEYLDLKDLRTIARVSKDGRFLAGLIWRVQVKDLFGHIEKHNEFFAKHADFYAQRVSELLFQAEYTFKHLRNNNCVIPYPLVIRVCKLYQALLIKDPEFSNPGETLPELAFESLQAMVPVEKGMQKILVFKEGKRKNLELLKVLNLYREFSQFQTEVHMKLLGALHLATLRPFRDTFAYTQARYNPRTGLKVIKSYVITSEQHHSLADLVNAIFKPSHPTKNLFPHNGCVDFIPLGDVIDYMNSKRRLNLKWDFQPVIG